MTPVEYNADYLEEKLSLDEYTAEFIANKLDERDFGRIITYKKVIVNGNGSMTIGDKKDKYTINIVDGYISDVTAKDGEIILTLDDIQNGYDVTPAGNDETTDTDNTGDEVVSKETQDEPEEKTTDTDTTNGTSMTTSSSSGKNSYLSEESQEIMDSLDTDYNKVNWGVQYSPTGMEGIVISVAPYIDNGSNYLAIAITNIYNEDATFSAKATLKGKYSDEVGSCSFYENAIRPGNTIIKLVYCSDVPTGEIHWEDIELPEVFDESAYWEADWALGTDADGFLKVDYTIYSNEKMTPGYVTGLVLDADGNIVAAFNDYNIDKGTELTGTITYYVSELPGKPVDVALFANPLVED